MNRIETVEAALAYHDPTNPWVKVYFDRVRFQDGREGRYVRIVENEGRPGVAVLPIRSDGHVGLVQVYRYPISKSVWEIPRGFGEGHIPEQDALRELREDTGLVPESLISLGSMYPNSGLMASTVHLFAASCPPGSAKPSSRDSEVSAFRWFRIGDVHRRIRNGHLKDGITLAALMMAQERGLLGFA